MKLLSNVTSKGYTPSGIFLSPCNLESVYSKYTVLLEKNLETTISNLRKNKIDAGRPIPVPAYQLLGMDEAAFPNAADCYNKLMELPVYPSLKKKEIEKIANTLLRTL